MPTTSVSLFDRGLADPKATFKTPQAVLEERSLTLDQKCRILREWEQDARLIEVADDEAMTGGEPPMLNDVLAALKKISPADDEQPGTPTKSGISHHGN